jgi:hypothetical protein
MYFLYMGLCIISTIITYLYIPETKRVPMEEIGALFGDEVVVHLTDDGHGILEELREARSKLQKSITQRRPDLGSQSRGNRLKAESRSDQGFLGVAPLF